MPQNGIITQICVVVDDIQKMNANWAKVLGMPEEKIETIFSGGITHYTHGQAVDYTGIQVAKYQLENFVLELLQPAESPSPWRAFLDRNGPGVFHFCFFAKDRNGMQRTLESIGVGMPYHIGYHPNGSYSYVSARDQLGLELSVNNEADYSELFAKLLNGTANPMDELK